MDVSSRVRSAPVVTLTLVGLEHLPCGCVAGVYQAGFDPTEVELVEAKGPHCVFFGHRNGKFIGEDLEYSADEEHGEGRI
jgi:hypothetical protein